MSMPPYVLKICNTCDVEKHLEQFYKNRTYRDGHNGRCKDCEKEAKKDYRVRNISKVRKQARDRSRENYGEGRLVYLREWKLKNKEKVQGYRENWKNSNPEKRNCHVIVGNAVRDGRLEKGPCEVCDSLEASAHHGDYSKPLEVRWLCSKHHGEANRKYA